MRARTSRFDTTAGWVCKAALVLLVGALVASKAVAEGGTSAKADESKSASEADVKRFEGFSKSVLEQLNKHKVLWREKLNARYAHLGDRGRSAGSWSELAVRQFDEHGWVVAEALMSVSGVLEQDGPGEWATRDLKKLNAELAALEAIEADADGARRIHGGRRPPGEDFKRGFWVEPTLYADVTPDMRLWQNEVFGPVLAVGKWRDFDQAVAMANSTEYGLTAAIWTNDLTAGLRMARKVRSGHIWVNGSSAHFLGVPFGGMKTSGIGREEGREEMFSYVETKSINIML